MSDWYLGEVRMFGGAFAPVGWVFCDGQELPIAKHQDLFGLIGSRYGGDGSSKFAVPDLRGRVPVAAGTAETGTTYAIGTKGGAEKVALDLDHLAKHRHVARAATTGGVALPNKAVWCTPTGANEYLKTTATTPMRDDAISFAGGSAEHDNVMPYLALNFIIAETGPSPQSGRDGFKQVEPMLAEIRLFATDDVPYGWAPCDGKELDISTYQALFSIMGTTYGGNGTTTFKVPDLRGRAPVHVGKGYDLGAKGGEESHALMSNELPQHTHVPSAATGNRSGPPIAGGVALTWGRNNSRNPFSLTVPTVSMDPSAVSFAGGGAAHPNMQPYTVLDFCIAVEGIFPRRGD